jgi:hypothetical protein
MKKVAMGSEEQKHKFSMWGAKQRVLERELKDVQKQEASEGLQLSDDEEADDDEEEKTKTENRKVKKMAKEKARKDRRGDQTANVLWSLRSKRNK